MEYETLDKATKLRDLIRAYNGAIMLLEESEESGKVDLTVTNHNYPYSFKTIKEIPVQLRTLMCKWLRSKREELIKEFESL